MIDPSGKFTREDLINASVNEWIVNCYCSPDDDDMPPDQKRRQLENMTDEELLEEAAVDEIYTLENYIDEYKEISPRYMSRFDPSIDDDAPYTEEEKAEIREQAEIIRKAELELSENKARQEDPEPTIGSSYRWRLEIAIVILRASAAVALGTVIGSLFPDMTGPVVPIWIATFIAIKYLTSFHWLGALLAFILLAGLQNQGDAILFFIGRCLLGAVFSFLVGSSIVRRVRLKIVKPYF